MHDVEMQDVEVIHHRTPQRQRQHTLWFLAVLLLGLLLRLVQYAWNTSFWCDESSLMLNVVHRGWHDLLTRPLDQTPLVQAAPPLLLVILKLLAGRLGASEYAARLPAMVFGLASLLIFAAVARRVFAGWWALLALALVAFSDNLIFQGAQTKPYTADAMCGAALLGILVCTPDWSPPRRMLLAALIAGMCVGLAYTAALAFAAVALSLLLEARREGWRTLAATATAMLPFGVVFVPLYLLVIRPQSSSAMLHRYWADDFISPLPWRLIPELLARLWDLGNYAVRPIGGILIAGLIVGLIRRPPGIPAALWRACALLFALTLAASIAGVYPFAGNRVQCYLIPALAILATAGAQHVYNLWPRYRLTVLPSIATATAGACVAISVVAYPRSGGDSRELFAYVRQHRDPQEPVFVVDLAAFDAPWYWPGLTGSRATSGTTPLTTDASSFWVVNATKPQRGMRFRDEVIRNAGASPDPQHTLRLRGGDAIRFVRPPTSATRPSQTPPQ